jgi:thiol-disulfide isomerase/thioredoxin
MAHPEEPEFSANERTTADAEGRFAFPRVAPGESQVGRYVGDGERGAASQGEIVEVRAGETTRVEVGGKGRPVIARIAAPEGLDPGADYATYSEFSIHSDRPMIPYPKEVLAKRDGSTREWIRRWWNSAEGRSYRRDWFSILLAKLRPDGTLRVEDVPSGDYVLELTYSVDPLRVPLGGQSGRGAHATKRFTIPEIPGGRTDEPFDLGVLHPQPKLVVGQPAPAFDVEALGDGRIKLEDFRGKYVLLDFWATWCGPCVAEVPALKALHDRFGKDPRFAMISLSLDADKDAPRKFVAEKGLGWTQGFLGDWPEGGAHEAYHVGAIPATFLIAPDGTIKAQDLRGPSIEAAVSQVLSPP